MERRQGRRSRRSWRPDEDDASKIRRLGKALTAVGEAYFFFAEEKRDDVEKIKFPEYKGPGAKEAVLKHIKAKVIDWIKKKRPAIEKAQAEYLKIVRAPADAAAEVGHRRRLAGR